MLSAGTLVTRWPCSDLNENIGKLRDKIRRDKDRQNLHETKNGRGELPHHTLSVPPGHRQRATLFAAVSIRAAETAGTSGEVPLHEERDADRPVMLLSVWALTLARARCFS